MRSRWLSEGCRSRGYDNIENLSKRVRRTSARQQFIKKGKERKLCCYNNYNNYYHPVDFLSTFNGDEI
jgi:hypothetical protein